MSMGSSFANDVVSFGKKKSVDGFGLVDKGEKRYSFGDILNMGDGFSIVE